MTKIEIDFETLERKIELLDPETIECETSDSRWAFNLKLDSNKVVLICDKSYALYYGINYYSIGIYNGRRKIVGRESYWMFPIGRKIRRMFKAVHDKYWNYRKELRFLDLEKLKENGIMGAR